MSVIRDDRTLFLCRLRPEDQVAQMVETAIEDAARLVRLESKEYRLNVHGQCAFVFVDSVVRNLLTGKNDDGTDRVEYSAVPPKTRAQLEQMSWKERHLHESASSGVRDLPPLVRLRRPDGTSPEVYEAWCNPAPASRMHNVIRSRDCPQSVTAAAIKQHFSAFATDSQTLVPRMVCGRVVSEAYPFVTINYKREVFVTFDPDGYDAPFVLLLSATPLISGNAMSFALSYRTERDIAASISRSPQVYSRQVLSPC